MSSIDTVICVHGFWSHGTGMVLIKRHFENEYGMQAQLFSYPSVSGTLDENAERLADFIRREKLQNCHIVAHSLGGVVSLRMLARGDVELGGRLVCMGSPLAGSRAAEFLQKVDWAGTIIGKTLPEGTLRSTANDWSGDVCDRYDVGIIAGNIPVGMGRLTGLFTEGSDGTVAISETRLAGATDHIELKVSHMGMLISRDVADQAAAFLKRGEFLRD
ncbi:MAG: alpha/beta fold hydrolase [Pseudomonadota bacterium]